MLLCLLCKDTVTAQTYFQLPQINVMDMATRQMINIANLPKDGKSKVVMVTSQSNKQIDLIGKLVEIKDRGKVPLDALYVITNDSKPVDKLPGELANLNDADANLLAELRKFHTYVYKDGKNEILQYYRKTKAPLIFFLDENNHIVFSYEEEGISAAKISDINNLINTKQVTADAVLYFDKNWLPTTRDKALYYRDRIRGSGKLYEVNDYYLNGKLQMKGSFTSVYPEQRTGVFSFYTDKGVIETESTYANNQLNGSYKSFYASGRLFSMANYSNGVLDGLKYLYYETGEKYSSGIFYKNNQGQGPVKYYYPDGKLKAEGTYLNDYYSGEWKGYDQSGNYLFDVHFKEGFIDASFPVTMLTGKRENVFSYYRDKAQNQKDGVMKREFKCLLNDGSFLEVGKEKTVTDVYNMIMNEKKGEEDDNTLYYSKISARNNGKDELQSEFIWNERQKIKEDYYYQSGSLVYSFGFKNDLLASGEFYYTNGKVCL
ncbi:MAG: toxin-antitoxin system YwqK family antitoxin, partial [Bacteroidota bacterium]|nr:toxin-antitoxin system YwqK family antitoxin [Bacteroidota bacterium]